MVNLCVSQVRVREMDEDEGVGANGRWVRTDRAAYSRVHFKDTMVRSGIISYGTTCVYDGMYSHDQVYIIWQ